MTKRTNARPKVHLIDTGISTRLLRLTEEKLARRDPTALTELGHPLENFVVGELLREAIWTEEIAGFGHWRTRDSTAVDLVLETDDGGVLAFEIKTAARVAGEDFKGLRQLRDLLGDAFIAGIALYTGAQLHLRRSSPRHADRPALAPRRLTRSRTVSWRPWNCP